MKSIRTKWSSIILIISGLILILGSPVIIELCRNKFLEIGPHVFTTLWQGVGGIILLLAAAGLPIGAVLVAIGSASFFSTSIQASRVLRLLPFMVAVYFIYHAIATFRYTAVPYLPFAIFGWLLIILFLIAVFFWADKRKSAEPSRQFTLDVMMASGICFFTAAWQSCGLAGAPGFALYPEFVKKLGNQSFNIGQAVAIMVFNVLGFVFLVFAMRNEKLKS